MVMKNETESDFDNNRHGIDPWNYVLVSFLFFNLVVTEWTNMTLLYSINKKKLNTVRAQLVKCMAICGALSSGLLIAPAGMAALGENGIISHTGCVFHNLIMQTSSMANRLIMLLLAVDQFCILTGKRGFRMSRSALSPVLFVLFLVSVAVSSLTVLQEGKYVTRRNVFLCVLPPDWLTITFEASSYIVPCVCIICITTYSVTNGGRTHVTNANTNSDMSASADIRPTQLSSNVSKTTVSISRFVITLSSLFVCSSFLRLIGVVFNYDPLFLIISLMCDTITYTVQPLYFVHSSSWLKDDFGELVIIRFSRTTTSVQVPSPSHELNVVQPPIPSVSGSLTTSIDTAKGNESSSNAKAMKMDEDGNISNDHKSLPVSAATETEKSWRKFTIPKETDKQKKDDFTPGACGGDSSLVQFESTVGLYKYVPACNPTAINVEINDIDDDLLEENFTDDSPENVHRCSFNERLRITYPYTQIDRSTSQRYSRTSSTNNRSHSLEMVQEDKQLMHMHGSVMRDSEQIMPSVQVDSIGIAASKQYRISSACPGLLGDPDNKSQQRSAPSWLESEDIFIRKESDTGELVVRKY